MQIFRENRLINAEMWNFSIQWTEAEVDGQKAKKLCPFGAPERENAKLMKIKAGNAKWWFLSQRYGDDKQM